MHTSLNVGRTRGLLAFSLSLALGALGLGCDREPAAKAAPPPAAGQAPAGAVFAAGAAGEPVAISPGAPYQVQCMGDANVKIPCGSITIVSDAATAGAEAKVHFNLAPTGIFHVNKEFPISLAITAPDVDLAKPKLGPDDVAALSTEGAAFDVKYTAKAAGAKTFNAVFRFAVCTPKTCVPSIEKLSWTVAVK